MKVIDWIVDNYYIWVPIAIVVAVAQFMYGCNAPKYVADIGFIPSATANSPEFPVFIEGTVCKDLKGQVGLCALRQDADKDFVVDFYAQPYDYELTFNCSSNVPGYPVSWLVVRNTDFKVTVPRTVFPKEKVFTCSAIITPKDRPEPIGSFARMTVTVVDSGYQRLENPYITKGYLVMGEHTLYGKYRDRDGWHTVEKTTVVKDTKGIVEVTTESYAGRHGYYVGASTVQTQGQL